MQKPFDRLFLDLIQNVLPSVHLHVDQIAREKKRAESTSWKWITGPNERKTYQRPFNEDDVQWVVENVSHLRPAGCPELMVNKQQPYDWRFEQVWVGARKINGTDEQVPLTIAMSAIARMEHCSSNRALTDA